DDASLRDLTAGGPEIEVSQHGYDHLPRRAEDGCKAEFIEGENFSLALEKGRQIIQRLFPTTFRGGFSAPFDVFPFGLCRSWEKLGGRYVSTVWAQPRETDLPLVRLGTDPWEWRQNKPHSIRHTIKEMKKSLEQKGYAGLVLHPQLLKIRGQVRHLEKLLNKVVGLKCRSVLISAAILKN
ncbi:MAG TPA: hypothetical protein VKJ65_08160, partial [Phycisphaerae bacterium]|nr:hypothetical protein [Phycisphaerae bacterium]